MAMGFEYTLETLFHFMQLGVEHGYRHANIVIIERERINDIENSIPNKLQSTENQKTTTTTIIIIENNKAMIQGNSNFNEASNSQTNGGDGTREKNNKRQTFQAFFDLFIFNVVVVVVVVHIYANERMSQTNERTNRAIKT